MFSRLLCAVRVNIVIRAFLIVFASPISPYKHAPKFQWEQFQVIEPYLCDNDVSITISVLGLMQECYLTDAHNRVLRAIVRKWLSPDMFSFSLTRPTRRTSGKKSDMSIRYGAFVCLRIREESETTHYIVPHDDLGMDVSVKGSDLDKHMARCIRHVCCEIQDELMCTSEAEHARGRAMPCRLDQHETGR